MKILNDLANLADTVRWTVVWKIEDLKNAVLNLFPSKDEADPFVGESYIESAPTKKKTKKSSKKKSKKSKK
jgi:hypothetical protein